MTGQGIKSKTKRKTTPKKKKAAAPRNPPMLGQPVTAPVAVGSIVQSPTPSIGAGGRGPKNRRRGGSSSLVVENSEYIGEVIGSTLGFLLGEFVINPGVKTVFPWLSGIARNFESYKFNKLNFMTKTETPTTTPGYIALKVDYDPADAPPVNKIQVLNAQSSVTGPAWSPQLTHVSEKHNLAKRASYYVSDGLQPVDEPELYDVGTLNVVTGQNTSSFNNTAIAQLWVDYSVELMTPQTDDAFLNGDPAMITGGGTMSASAIMGDAPVVNFGLDNVGPTQQDVDDNAALNVINLLEPGDYIIVVVIGGSGITAFSATGLNDVSLSLGTLSINAAATNATRQFYIRINASNPVTPGAIDFTATATTITSSATRIAAFPFG